MNQQQAKYRRMKHWIELKELGYIGASLGKINSIERTAHRMAEDWCNGVITEHEYDKRLAVIMVRLKAVFDGTLPDGLFINSDARGYALKIESEKTQGRISYTDWGGYGILAPEDL